MSKSGLTDTYNDILAEADRIADLRNGFIKADVVAVDDPNRSW